MSRRRRGETERAKDVGVKVFGDEHGDERRVECAAALSAGVDAPSRARAFVREQVLDARLPEDVLADLLVIVSELVSNAVQHGEGDPRLELRLHGTRVRVDVGDEAVDATPVPRPHDRTASRGRGLGIISAVADQWGHEVRGGAKWIWAELDTAQVRAVSAEPVA